MPAPKRPRRGSLQIYPRKRISKYLPSVNWSVVSSKSPGLLGFITYKVGMATAVVKDLTDKSMTLGKKIAIPVTILEAPNMKIFSVRFYKNNRPIKEIVVSNDKELKKKLKVPRAPGSLDNLPESYDEVRVIVYSLPKQTSIKKTPDLAELAIHGENKLEIAKSLIGKEIPITAFLRDDLLDVRGLTTGKGNQGPVKRFGIGLRHHKSEKGVRKVGSIGPWHPVGVKFRVPMAGQLGLFTRVIYNNKVISSGTIADKNINPLSGFKNYGLIKTSYLIIKGSVQGPAKRQILITPAFRPKKEQSKKKFELVELVTSTK